MRELKRLLDASGNSEAKALLESALVDEPPARAFERTAVSIGIVGVGAALPGVAHGAAAGGVLKGGTSGALAVAKWLFIGALSGSVVVTTAVLTTPTPDAARAAVAARSAVENVPQSAPRAPAQAFPPAQASPATAPAASSQESAELRPPSASPPVRGTTSVASQEPHAASMPPTLSIAPSVAATAPDPSQLRAEVEMIDAARAALASRQLAAALAVLNRYEAEVVTHVLDREARLLRIDALTQAGERASAARLARAYLNDFPSDPHATRLQALSASVRESTP